MSFVEQIQRRVHAKTTLYATWLPTDPIRVGDYGYLRKGRFNREGNTQQKGIKPTISRHATNPSKLGFSDRAKFMAKAGVNAAAIGEKANAELEITLHDEGAFVYQLQDMKMSRIADKDTYFRDLFLAILDGKLRWQDDFLIVDEVRQAGSATLLVLESAQGRLRVKGKGQLDMQAEAPLADVGGNIDIRVEEGSIFQAVCESEASPFYNPRRLIFTPPDGGGGAGAAFAAAIEWVREKLGRPVMRPDDVRMVDYVSESETWTFEVVGTHRFEAKAELVSIEQFLELGNEEEAEGQTLELGTVEESQYVARAARSAGG